MKKFLAFICIVTLVGVAYYNYTPEELDAQGIWGRSNQVPMKTVVVADTTSLTTYDTIVSESGQGFIKRILFNNSSASYDPSVIVNIDGYLDTLTEASAEEVTRFITLIRTPSANGNDQYLVAGDSTAVAGLDLDIPYRTHFSVKIKSENASGITRCTVIYAKQ